MVEKISRVAYSSAGNSSAGSVLENSASSTHIGGKIS